MDSIERIPKFNRLNLTPLKESKWFSSLVILILISVNGLSFMVMQSQKLSVEKMIIAMGVLGALTLTYLVFQMRTKAKRKNR